MNVIVKASPSMNSSNPQNQNPEGPRRCSKCKALVPIMDPYKRCADCREKNRLLSAQYMQRKRALLLAQREQENGNVSAEMKRKLGDRAEVMQQETKRPKMVHVSGEVVSTVNGESENKKKKQKKQVEYQTPAEMYHKLNTCSKTKKYLFNGRSSIIANPEIDNNQRVKIVAKDLRKIVNVPFEGTSITSFVGKDTFGATFRCNCLDQGAHKHVATLYNRNPNAIVPSPLDSVVPTQANDIPHCKGTITVISEDDDSHPLGITGQKISITVKH